MNSSELSFFRKVVDSSGGVIVFSLDRTYRYTSFTQSHQEIMRKIWNVEIKLGDDILSFLPNPDREKAKDSFDRALRGEHFSKIEEYGDVNLSRSFWQDRYDPIFDDEGNVVGLVVFVLEVSDYVQFTSQIDAVRNRFKFAVEASGIGVWEWNLETNAVEWTEEIFNIFGVSEKELKVDYDLYKKFIHPHDVSIVEDALSSTVHSGASYHIEHRIINAQGKLKWLKAQGKLLLDSKGKAQKLLGTVQDITEFRRVEGEKMKWKSRYELIARYSGQMIYDFNVSTGEIEWNGSTEEILGYTHAEMGDIVKWEERLHPDERERVIKALEEAQRNLSKFDVVYRFRNAAGEYRIMSDHGYFFIDTSESDQVRMAGIMEDITTVKRNEMDLMQKNAELTKINQELDKFVYSASHDLRAPIASLMGLISIARQEQSPEQLQSLFEKQERSLIKLDNFIQDIVDYSRNARTSIASNRIDFRLLVEEVFEQFHFIESLRKIRCQIEVMQDSVFYGDQKRCEIILKNLVSNAIKYADLNKPEPFINVQIQVSDLARIDIIDNGEGIAAESISRVFDMFYRASVKSVGSGLGLYIVRETLDKLNGKITVESVAGEGSKFSIYIPNQPPQH